MTHTLSERTYINADGSKVVPEGSPEAHSLLGVEGDEITDERAKALGLASKKAKKDEPEAKG